MVNHAINISNLEFSYPGQSRCSLADLNLDIPEGARFGLFGPNGAGKTTLMHCMTGLLPYHKGTIKILGQKVGGHKKKVNELFGFVPQDFSFYQELSPRANLEFFGAWYGIGSSELKKRIDRLLEVLHLSDVSDKQVQQFSGGMKRRVNLAIGVINHPRVLFLDEPTVGVDIQTRHAIIQYLKQLNKEGTTLIYTSHQLSEAEELCDRVVLLDKGKILVHDTLDRLLHTHQESGLEGLYLGLTGKLFKDSDDE